MKKVIIVDDEVQVRKGLRMKIDWTALGYEIIGEAANGLEALHFFKEFSVDLIITDVRMPQMNGIELVKRCRQEFPTTKIILLSGYSEFEYARSAMREGVKHYLLKPIAPDELIETLEKITIEWKKEYLVNQSVFRLKQKVDRQLQEEQEQYLLQLAKEDFIDIVAIRQSIKQLKLDHFLQEEQPFHFISVELRNSKRNPHTPKDLWEPFRMLCREIAKERGDTYCFYDPSYSNMIHFVESSSSIQSRQRLEEEIAHYVKTYMNLEAVIGVGTILTGYANFKKAYRSSLLSWSQSEIGAHSQILDIHEEKEIFTFSAEIERKIINSIENNRVDSFKEHIHSLLGRTQNHSIMSFSFVSNRLLFLLDSLISTYNGGTMEIKQLLWNSQQYIWELNAQGKVVDSLQQLGEMMIEYVQQERCSVGIETVENVRYYLEHHYGDDISLTALSEKFHINAAYLSELYKSHYGQNLSDYLLHLRMEKAIKLLEEKELKIIDVAQLVGFSSSGYFSTVFKKYYGLSPIDFRKTKVG